MKQYPQTVSFVSLAVRLVVWTPLLILTLGCVGISQFVQKKTTNRGWKEETDKHGFRTANLRKVKSGTFKHFVYICLANAKTAKIRHSYRKCWPSSSLLCILTPFPGVSLPTDHFRVSLRTNWPSAPEWSLRGLTPNWLTLFILLFRSRRFSWAQLFEWSSRQSRQRGPSKHSDAGQGYRR